MLPRIRSRFTAHALRGSVGKSGCCFASDLMPFLGSRGLHVDRSTRLLKMAAVSVSGRARTKRRDVISADA